MTVVWDIVKERKDLYKPSAKHPSIVEVPEMAFLMIDGSGDPNGAEFSEKVGDLYSAAYTMKFSLKKDSPELDFKVAPLDGLWWAPDMAAFTEDHGDKSSWLWTAMIAVPDFITAGQLAAATEQAFQKKGNEAVREVRLERYAEGLAVQMMHIGPYSEEAPNIRRMHEFAREQGYAPAGKHHEIYLSDPGRTAPERLKTVIRQPVAPE